jgi:hypothetical protein
MLQLMRAAVPTALAIVQQLRTSSSISSPLTISPAFWRLSRRETARDPSKQIC